MDSAGLVYGGFIEIVDHDSSAGCGELKGNGTADSPPRSRDERGAATQVNIDHAHASRTASIASRHMGSVTSEPVTMRTLAVGPTPFASTRRSPAIDH